MFHHDAACIVEQGRCCSTHGTLPSQEPLLSSKTHGSDCMFGEGPADGDDMRRYHPWLECRGLWVPVKPRAGRGSPCVAEGLEGPANARCAEDASTIVDDDSAVISDAKSIQGGCELGFRRQHMRQVCAVIGNAVQIEVLRPRNASLLELRLAIPACTSSACSLRHLAGQ